MQTCNRRRRRRVRCRVCRRVRRRARSPSRVRRRASAAQQIEHVDLGGGGGDSSCSTWSRIDEKICTASCARARVSRRKSKQTDTRHRHSTDVDVVLGRRLDEAAVPLVGELLALLKRNDSVGQVRFVACGPRARASHRRRHQWRRASGARALTDEQPRHRVGAESVQNLVVDDRGLRRRARALAPTRRADSTRRRRHRPFQTTADYSQSTR